MRVCVYACTHTHTHIPYDLEHDLTESASLAFQPLTERRLAELGWCPSAASCWLCRGWVGKPQRSGVDAGPSVPAAGAAELRGPHSQDRAPDRGSQPRVLSAAPQRWRNPGRKLRRVFFIIFLLLIRVRVPSQILDFLAKSLSERLGKAAAQTTESLLCL